MYKNKFGDSIFKERMQDLIKSDKYISELKVQATYNEVFNGLGEERQKSITPEKREKLLQELYKNAENAFIKRINYLIDKYRHKDEKDEQEFIESVERAYKKYCSNEGVAQPENVSEEILAQNVAEEKIKENKFIGQLIILTKKYNSDKDDLLLEYIDDFTSKYGTEDVVAYIEKAGKLCGLADYEIESLVDHITGKYINPFICRRNIPLFSLYQFYKSDKYNEKIDPDDDGIIDLDDYAYITSSRAAESSIGVKWIINSYLDTYLAFSSSHDKSNCRKLSNNLTKILEDAKGLPFDEITYKQPSNNPTTKQDDNDPFYTIRRYAKKLSDLIQESHTDISSTAQITSQEVEKYTDVLRKIIDGDSTEEEIQKNLLKKIDDQTPTTTSDKIIDDLIEKINDPSITITPRDVLEELITDSKEVQVSRQDKINSLIYKIADEICSLLEISGLEARERVINELQNLIDDTRPDIKEKNAFLMPQLAKQLGIETAIFYKTTEADSRDPKEDITPDKIVDVLREYKLVDDTKFHLTKNFIKIGETYISAKSFIKEKDGSSMIEMKHILEATEKYIKEKYRQKGFSKKEADDTYKTIRTGIIKQSLFNKLVNNSDESNNTWGLIEDVTGHLRLSPMFNFKGAAGCHTGNSKIRVVDKNKDYIDDFLIVYSKEEWFKEWIDNAVINLDFDKANDEMMRKTGVILTPLEKSYYKSTIFDKMHSIIINASEVNYDTEEIIRARKDRMSMLERLNYSRKNVRSKMSEKKHELAKTLKPSWKKTHRKSQSDDKDER